MIACVMTAKLATYYELQTIYSVEDLHDMVEIVIVNGHNDKIAIDSQKDP